MLTCPDLAQHTAITHGFFTRQGGVSQGIYDSLNVAYGSDDDPENVTENRQRTIHQLGVSASLCTLYQTHSSNVVTITKPWEYKDSPHADAMVTNQPGLALGILTADCAPVLFADPRHNIIAAAHAGWKGALGGILKNTVEAMVALGAAPATIHATIGPCIQQDSYEIGQEFYQNFCDQHPDYARYFIPSNRDNHHRFDLQGFSLDALRKLKLNKVSALNRDTLSDPEHFFSYRRATLASEPDYGRQISVIALRP